MRYILASDQTPHIEIADAFCTSIPKKAKYLDRLMRVETGLVAVAQTCANRQYLCHLVKGKIKFVHLAVGFSVSA